MREEGEEEAEEAEEEAGRWRFMGSSKCEVELVETKRAGRWG